VPGRSDVPARGAWLVVTRSASSTTFVGRQLELGVIEQALAATQTAGPGVLTIVGEAGIGKTRLAAESARRAKSAHHRVGSGRCLNVAAGGQPFGPFREALAELLGPRPAGQLFRARDTSPRGSDERAALFDAVADAIHGKATADAAALVVVEDVHWSDRSTRDLISMLAGQSRLRLLVLLTARREEVGGPTELASFLVDLELRGAAGRLNLGPLSDDEVARQARAIVGHDLDPLVLEHIRRRSEGNPLYVEELAAAAAVGRHAELPPTLADAILVRVAELPKDAQHVLRLCAVGGPRVTHGLLRAIAELPDKELETALRLAIRRQLLRSDVRRDEDAYVFRHALVHEVLYQDMLPPERTRFHALFARALERHDGLYADPVLAAAERARHQEAAHDVKAARLTWALAAREAIRALAYPEADLHFGRALAIPPSPDEGSQDQAGLLEEAAAAARMSGSAARAVELTRQAISVTPSSDLERRTRLYVDLSGWLWDIGRSREALQASADAARMAASLPASHAKATALASYASVQLVLGFPESCLEAAQDAYEVARTVNSSSMMGWALAFLGPAKVCLGRLDEGVADARQSWELVRHGPHDDVPVYAAQHYLTCVALAHGSAAADALGVELIGEAEARAINPVIPQLRAQVARGLLQLGRFEEAEQAFDRVELAIGPQPIDVMGLADRAVLAAARGRFEQAHEFLRRAVELTPDTDELHVLAPSVLATAYVATAEGDPDGAIEAVERGLRAGLPGARDLEFIWPLLLVGMRAAADVAETARGRRSTSATAIVKAAESAAQRYADRLLDEVFTDSPNPEHALWRALAVAELERALGRDEPERWAIAVGHAGASQLRVYLAYVLMRHAISLARDPAARVEATRAMREAHELCRDMGAVALRREVERRARHARIHVRGEAPKRARAASDGVLEEGLSDRELEVLALLCAGRSNRQIAEALFITEKTAGAHVSNILSKLGVASRGEAAALALRRNLVEA
jgi:DNA-binding CsgD family transcriptional regulator